MSYAPLLSQFEALHRKRAELNVQSNVDERSSWHLSKEMSTNKTYRMVFYALWKQQIAYAIVQSHPVHQRGKCQAYIYRTFIHPKTEPYFPRSTHLSGFSMLSSCSVNSDTISTFHFFASLRPWKYNNHNNLPNDSFKLFWKSRRPQWDY